MTKLSAQFRSVCDDIETLTGFKTILFGVDQKVLHAQKNTMCSFCKKLREVPSLNEKCIECDRNAFSQSEQSDEILIYHCHIGFVEAIAPIMDNGLPIGYLMFGQILPEGEKAAIRRAIEALPEESDKPALHALLDAYPETSEARIRAAARILAMCSCYVHLKSMLSVPKGELIHHIAAYITEHLADPSLSVLSICSAVGISRTALYMLSKQAFGKGISEYIRATRAKEAQRLLKNTNASAEEIARQVGLSGSDQLARLLKRDCGTSIRALRKA